MLSDFFPNCDSFYCHNVPYHTVLHPQIQEHFSNCLEGIVEVLSEAENVQSLLCQQLQV